MRVILVAPSRSDPAHRRLVGSLRRELTRAGDSVRVFPPKDGLADVELRRRLEGLLLASPGGICHVHFFSRGLGYMNRVSIPPRTRLVLTHQGASFSFMERVDVFRRLARRADRLSSVSKDGSRRLRSLFPGVAGRCSWIPNGAEPASRGRRRKSPRRPFALCVGRPSAYKATDVLLMAFAGAAARAPELDLVICGPDQTGGRLAGFAERLGISGRVRFLGDVPHRRVRRLLEDCLFFVLPSREENMPMALLEAMAAGKAAIASSAGGMGEVVRDGEDGLLVRPKDVPALTGAMLRLARDRKLRERLGRGASRRARLFGWGAVAAGYRRLYASALAQRGP